MKYTPPPHDVAVLMTEGFRLFDRKKEDFRVLLERHGMRPEDYSRKTYTRDPFIKKIRPEPGRWSEVVRLHNRWTQTKEERELVFCKIDENLPRLVFTTFVGHMPEAWYPRGEPVWWWMTVYEEGGWAETYQTVQGIMNILEHKTVYSVIGKYKKYAL